jgi:response regulator RpfG family c-di-GMP phosphodiesterase
MKGKPKLDKNDLDEQLKFASEDESEKISQDTQKWKILIVDDEEEIHNVTKLALSDVSFKGIPIELLDAYSEKDTIQIIKNHPDISIILLDIVMEEDNSGLRIIQYIRNELKNSFVRIIIRTAQPGQAPERKVIVDYDINDYKEKAELTSQKLFSTIIASLRSYHTLLTLEQHRLSLEKLLETSNTLFLYRRIEEFAENILEHIFNIFLIHDSSFNKNVNGFLAINRNSHFTILSAYGQFKNSIGKELEKVLSPGEIDTIKSLNNNNHPFCIESNHLFHIFKSKTEIEYLIYIDCLQEFSSCQVSLLKLVFTTISSAFDNICLSNDIINTQSELLITLGQVVETRSNETGNHVRRVAEYSKLLALKYGLSEEEAELLKQATPMHDIGKVGIFDHILNKPDKLDPSEFDIMKTHTTIGYEIFKNSTRKIFQTSSLIALEHHEKYDGTGYPRGLKGEEIHIYGRIVSLADIFDAIGSDRVYKKAWKLDNILDFLKKESGKTFDPKLIKIFFENLDEILSIRNRFKDG